MVDEIEDFISESAIMLDFQHPNVMGLLGVCFDTENNLPLIVLPFMANGDLKSYLVKLQCASHTNSELPKVNLNIIIECMHCFTYTTHNYRISRSIK